MRFVTFLNNRKSRIGVLIEDDSVIVDLSIAAPNLPRDMNAFIAAGPRAKLGAQRAVKKSGKNARLSTKRQKILAPIPVPIRNIMAVGKNYYDHAQEFDDSGFNQAKSGAAIPEFPIIFTKATSSVIGSGEPIPGYSGPRNNFL